MKWMHLSLITNLNYYAGNNTFFFLPFIFTACIILIRSPILYRGDNMDKKEQEKQNKQKNLNEFNSITQKVTPENQNQHHNVRKEAVDPKRRQVWNGCFLLYCHAARVCDRFRAVNIASSLKGSFSNKWNFIIHFSRSPFLCSNMIDGHCIFPYYHLLHINHKLRSM